MWIGASDRGNEGHFSWDTGSSVVAPLWHRSPMQNEPDGGIAENCVAMSISQGRWFDRACINSLPYWCMKAFV